MTFTTALGDGANSSTSLGNTIEYAHIRFEDDGTFTLDVICNQGSGTYVLEDDRMTTETVMGSNVTATAKTKPRRAILGLNGQPTAFIELSYHHDR